MTKTERKYVTELNAEMPEFTGDPIEVEKKIAMYIYLKLGKSKVFDERYKLANAKEQKKMAQRARLNKWNIEKIIKNRKIVCITMARLYARLLNDFGIKAIDTTLYNRDGHVSNIITFSNGEKIITDLDQDLSNIQTKSMTTEFGRKYEHGQVTNDAMTAEELFKLHKACGYVNSIDDYQDLNIAELGRNVKGCSPDEVLKRIMEDKKINDIQEDIGYVELYTYYSNIVYKAAPRLDKNGIYYCNCYRQVQTEDGEMKKEYCMCMYSVYDNNIEIYIYSNKDKKFKKVGLEQLANLEKEGLFIGKNPNEKGIKLLRRYLNKFSEEQIKKKYEKNFEQNGKIDDILK